MREAYILPKRDSVVRESVLTILLSTLAATCALAALFLNSGSGSIDVSSIMIQNEISATLYRPKIDGKLPAAVLVHGVSSSKESMSALALELARRGIVALCIDARGHGDSGGHLNLSSDPTIGLNEALEFLRSKDFVDKESIILIGHSLGAYAAMASSEDSIANVLLGGGISMRSTHHGELNATHPRNLLIIIGRGDALFDLNIVRKELGPAFGTEEVIAGKVYGDFRLGTARKLVITEATHLLEPIDGRAVSEAVDWACLSLGRDCNAGDLIYPYRDLLMSLSIFSILTLAFPFSKLLLRSEVVAASGKLRESLVLIIWILPFLALFVPSFLTGMSLGFPPVLFGSSIALWFLLSSAYGSILIILLRRKYGSAWILKDLRRQLLSSFAIFLAIYSLPLSIKAFFGLNIWLYVPILRALDARRAILMICFIPFFLAYFLIESLICGMEGDASRLGFAKFVCVRVAPIVALLSINYTSMFLLNIRIFPSLVGFSLEFLPIACVLFAIASSYTRWFSTHLGSPVAGALLNSLLLSWASASVFPFGSFS